MGAVLARMGIVDPMLLLLLFAVAPVRSVPELMKTYSATVTSNQVSPHHTIYLESAAWFDVEIGHRVQSRSRIDGGAWGPKYTQLDCDELNQSYTIESSSCAPSPLVPAAAFGLNKLANATLVGYTTVSGLNCSHWYREERSMLQLLTVDAFLHQLTDGPEKGRMHAVHISEVWSDGAGSYPSETNFTDVKSLIGMPMGSEPHIFDLPLQCSANTTCSNDAQCPPGVNSICCSNGQCAADVRAGCRCVEGCAGPTYCCSSGIDAGWCRHSCN